MAFTTEEILSIAQMLGQTVAEVEVHLITFAPTISAEAETAVRALITQYEDLPADTGVEVHPTEANFGAKITNVRGVAEGKIIKNLRSLLNIPQFGVYGYSTTLERG